MKCNACGQEDIPPNGAYRPLGDLGIEVICFACIFVLSLNGAKCGLCDSDPCMGFVATQHGDERIQPMAMCPSCISDCRSNAEMVVSGGAEGNARIPILEAEREV